MSKRLFAYRRRLRVCETERYKGGRFYEENKAANGVLSKKD